MSVRDAIMAIWREMVTPSRRDEGPYLSVLIAIAHAMVGATFVSFVAVLPWAVLPIARAGIPLVYWLAKERGDIRRGGSVLDGLTDAGFVALGAAYGGASWPATVLGAAVCVTILRVRIAQSSADYPTNPDASGGYDDHD